MSTRKIVQCAKGKKPPAGRNRTPFPLSRYFQGNSVQGPVKASAARNFREVVDALRICPTLGITRDAFLALDKKRRNEIKQVPFFVPACFKESPSPRVYAQAKHCNLIFLDLDETKDGKCPAAPFVNNPETLYAALDGLNFAAHTTASSTPEKPRMRIVLEANQIPVSGYARAVATIGARLGLATVNRESQVAVQPMFLPTLFSDSDDADHPLIAHRTDAAAFEVVDISDALFPEYTEPKTPLHGADALDFLRAPVPEITLAIAKEALDAIDPDCSYYEWLEVAAALRHQFSPHKAEESYQLFDAWSEGGSKYGSAEDTRAKWDSLRPTPVGRMPITIRSLLRQAASAGWDDKRVKENSFKETVKWLDGAETITELMEKGVRKILAAPSLSAIQEGMLIDHLRVQAKAQFGYKAVVTDIRTELKRLKNEIRQQEKPAEKLKEPLWAKGVLYVAACQEFYRHRTGEKYKSESFNDMYSRQLLPSEESLNNAGIPITPANMARPIVTPKDYALNHLKITTVYDYAYDPSQPAEVFFVHRGRKYVNTYSPTYPEIDPKNAEGAGALFTNHLRNLVAEADYRRILTDFIAFLVQFPGHKVRWAVLLQSVEGAGKTFLAEVAKAVLGTEHVKTISGEAIKKGWNEWSFGSQLVVLEEVRVAGTNRHEIMNALKPLVTNDDISINERNRNTRQAPNISNYMLFSNHHDALALTPGDRRYFVIKSPLQHKQQVLTLGENYFPPLYAMLRDHAGALRAWLTDWEISSDFRPDGHAPRTVYVTDMVNDSASDLTAAVRRLLLEGDYPMIQFDIVSAKTLLDVLHLEENISRATAQQLGQVLREEGFEQIGRHQFGTERHYLWVRRGADTATAVDTVASRVLRGAKNLGMEILF
jgi:hypothetical protein